MRSVNYVNNPIMSEATGNPRGGLGYTDDWGFEFALDDGFSDTSNDFGLNDLLDSVPDILQAWLQFEQGMTLNEINEARGERGLYPITSQNMSAMNSYAQQYPQQFAQYQMGGGGFNMQSLMPILLIGGVALAGVLLLKRK